MSLLLDYLDGVVVYDVIAHSKCLKIIELNVIYFGIIELEVLLHYYNSNVM